MINIEKQFIERRGKCMKYLIGIDEIGRAHV